MLTKAPPVEYSGQNTSADTHTEEVSQTSNEDIVPDDIDLDALPFR